MPQNPVLDVHRRDITPRPKKEASYRHSLSILSSIARLFAKKEPSTRLSESFKARYPSAVIPLPLSSTPSHMPQAIQSTQLTQSMQSMQSAQPTQAMQSMQSAQPTQAVQSAQPTQLAQATQPTPSMQSMSSMPSTQPTKSPQKTRTPPPPPPMPVGLTRLSPITEEYQPPKPVQCKPQTTPPPIPKEALHPSHHETPKMETPNTETPKTETPKTETPIRPAQPLPTDFLAAIRQAGTERQEKALKAAQTASSDAVTSTSSPPPPSSLQRSFLQEIVQAGTERQNRINSIATTDTSSAGSRFGTIRRTGTLGGNSRVSERFGSDIMNDLHNENKGTLRVQTDGEAAAAPVQNTAKKSLFDEIRHFDLAKLKRVEPSDQVQKKDVKKKENGTAQPSVAELMHSRLMVMQSDSSSDSDDSRFEFSD